MPSPKRREPGDTSAETEQLGLNPDAVRVIVWVKSILASWKHNIEIDVRHGVTDGKAERLLYHETKHALRSLLDYLKDDHVDPRVIRKFRDIIGQCDLAKYDNAHELCSGLCRVAVEAQTGSSDSAARYNFNPAIYRVSFAHLVDKHKDSCKKQLASMS